MEVSASLVKRLYFLPISYNFFRLDLTLSYVCHTDKLFFYFSKQHL